jgi:gamma-glutamylputrescine oxidase
MSYCGHGVNASHMAGEVIADAMTGTMERLDMFERIGHRKIPFGQTFGSQMLALGMLCFRMHELL